MFARALFAGLGIFGVVTWAHAAPPTIEASETRQLMAQGAPPPLPQPAAVQYFYGENGKPIGPLTLADMQAKIAAGIIKPDTLVWKTGAPGWVASKDLPDFAPLFASSCNGRVILSDSFKSLDGNWMSAGGDPLKPLAVDGGKLKIKQAPGKYYLTLYNGKQADNADICITVQTPNSYRPNTGQDDEEAGVVFLAKDSNNWHAFTVSTSGSVVLSDKVQGEWHEYAKIPVPSLDVSSGSKNLLHVNLTHFIDPTPGEVVTLELNGKLVIRAKYSVQEGGTMFGLIAESSETLATEWKFVDLKVTEGTQ